MTEDYNHDSDPKPIDSFQELYLEGCSLRREEPVHLDLYQDLDNVVHYIENSHDVKNLLDSIKDDRICIALPYDSDIICSDIPPDSYTDDNKPLWYVSSFEKYRIRIVKKFDNKCGSVLFDNSKDLNKWKLRRIEKMYSVGWKKFSDDYILKCTLD